MFEEKYKKAIDLLRSNLDENFGKNRPLLPHLLRIGRYLHENGYSEDIVNAGLLHDSLEWTGISEERIREEFSARVLDIVRANTKDRSIEDPIERRRDYVLRCADVGIDALIVKAADALDSFSYYSEAGNEKEIERSMNIASLILKHVDADQDDIFLKLRRIAN